MSIKNIRMYQLSYKTLHKRMCKLIKINYFFQVTHEVFLGDLYVNKFSKNIPN